MFISVQGEHSSYRDSNSWILRHFLAYIRVSSPFLLKDINGPQE